GEYTNPPVSINVNVNNIVSYKITSENGVFIRSERKPSDNSNKMTKLSKGSLLQIVDHKDNGKFANGYHWWFVKFGTSATTGDLVGWCAGEYLQSYGFPQNSKKIEGVEITAYYSCVESEIEEIADTFPEKYNPTGSETIEGLGTFNRAFLYSAKGVVMQGSGRDKLGRLIKCRTSSDWIRDEDGDAVWIADENAVEFYEAPLWSQSPWDISRGALWYGISPWHSIAVDPDVIPLGSIVYIKELDGKELSNGERLDGYFVAEDTGGGIEGKHIDLFVGTGNAALSEWWNIQEELKDKIDSESKRLKLDVQYDDSGLWSSKKAELKSPAELKLYNSQNRITDIPAELRVYDSQDRITGLVDGEVKTEIPYSIYSYFDKAVTIVFPTDSYHYEIKGIGKGTYGLTITSISKEKNDIFNSTDIPISNNTIHRYTINWSALSQGLEGITLQIDADGDGAFEQTITSDGELTHDEFLLKTETKITKPEKALYIVNNKILSLFTPLIIGSIDIEVNVFEELDINHVEFYIDDKFKANDTTEPYVWTWDEKTFGRHTIKVIAYDNAGNHVSKQITVWKFF
ncbi:MAG TPA: hypothetical protein ENI49_04135, partial [Thermoplasmatales archaeon]|nr:hypothetical protein [Thermoplasmatales archaeon]